MFDHTCTCGCRATIHNPVYGWQCLPCWNDAKSYVETDGVVRCPDTGKRIQTSPQVVTMVRDLDLRSDLQFVSDSQDVQPIKEYLGREAEPFDSFFVRVDNGDYAEVYGMYGIVPQLTKPLFRLL